MLTLDHNRFFFGTSCPRVNHTTNNNKKNTRHDMKSKMNNEYG